MKIALIIAGLLVAFAGGYYLAPSKVETKVVEIEKKTDTERDKHRETTTTETVKPDGTKQVVTIMVEDTNTKRKTETKEDTKSVSAPAPRPRISLSALGGLPVSYPFTPVFGAHVSKEILGPITIGAWGLSSMTFGISMGVNF